MIPRILCLVGLLAALPALADTDAFQFELPQVILNDIPFSAQIRIAAPADGIDYALEVNGQKYKPAKSDDDKLIFEDLTAAKTGLLPVRLIQDDATVAQTEIRSIAAWLSIVPPLLGILVALFLRSVVPALFLGVWVGAWLVTGLSFTGLGSSLLAVFHVHVRDAFADPDHAAIMLFTLMIGGMVGIIFKNGGMEGLVAKTSRWAKTPRQGQLVTAALGTVIFFDDYSNTMVVGNAMRPVTDRLGISREKLAFLVDATAAPIACIALVTTWVGYEVGLIDAAIGNLATFNEPAYLVYIQSIGYSFYPLLMLMFVFLIAGSKRDFGAMAKAERRARAGHVASIDSEHAEMSEAQDLLPGDATPRRALNGIIPIIVLIAGVVLGLLATGEGETLLEIIGSSDPYKALMWSSLVAALVAGTLTLLQRIMTLEETVMAWCAGMKMMFLAMIVLILAWSLASLTEILHTAGFLVSILGDAIPIGLVPFSVFLIAALTAFSTGTSWGAMGILLPVVVPLTWAILDANSAADPAHYHIMYSAIACVLSGAVWGDHCSPISDTTILSSMASRCNHIDHVTTQMPYALVVGTVALLVGTIPVGFGMPWWLGLVISATALCALFFAIGRVAPADEPGSG
ncbi:MAG: Na+/H+ antiporter NhaC family protein [Gammaproteobacteria bacterium]|nr:Na+/H+ antiporter NhaC family protein [Gammaproteobacteria bacterium]